jgi:hypothetical protein
MITADELLHELVFTPDRSYQPAGKPSGWPKKTTASLT